MEENEIIFNNSYFNKNDILEKNIEDKLSIKLNLIKKELHYFISKSIKRGYKFNIKLNEKKKRIKLFITLINNSDTNKRNEDIDFLIEANEEYPEKPPMVFCLSCVK